MDRSFDFRRRANYWQSVLHTGAKASLDPLADHKAVDRFSIISSSVFTQLQTLDALLTPYVVSPLNVAGKEHIGGNVQIPNVQNAMSYIQAKRELFEQTDIKDIVNDTRVAGDLIKQMKASIEEQPKREIGKTVSKHLHEHRLGVIACLQHVLKSVQTSVEEYERYRLNTEANVNLALGIMMEDKVRSNLLLKEDSAEGQTNKFVLSKDYISLFFSDPVKQENKASAEATATGADESTPHLTPVFLSRQNSFALGSQANKRNPSVSSYRPPPAMESLELPREGEFQMLQQEHKAIVTKVHEAVQMSELNTINNVQQRLTEISSMFEQFSGTLAVQLDMFECINANVMESLSNIETTESTLKKSDSESMPYHQLLMCYAFVSCAIFLLLVDYLKSHPGSYLF